MKRCFALLILCAGVSPAAAADASLRTVLEGLRSPASVAAADDGRVFVTVRGVSETKDGGLVLVVKDGKAEPFSRGVDDPRGLTAFREFLFVADRDCVLRLDRQGKSEVFADAEAFPFPPRGLRD